MFCNIKVKAKPKTKPKAKVKEPAKVPSKNSRVVFTLQVKVRTTQGYSQKVADRIVETLKELDRGLAATTLEVTHAKP